MVRKYRNKSKYHTNGKEIQEQKNHIIEGKYRNESTYRNIGRKYRNESKYHNNSREIQEQK